MDRRGYPDTARQKNNLARCSRPLCSSQRTEDDRPPGPASPEHPGGTTPERSLTQGNSRPFPQDPTACLRPAPPTTTFPTPRRAAVLAATNVTGRTGQRSTL